MNSLYPAGLIALFSPFFVDANETVHTSSSTSDEGILFQGQTLNLVVPECPLALGSVKIIPRLDSEHFSEWQPAQTAEAYALIQAIVRIWEERDITDYLIYGKESDDPQSIFSWEIVPYPKNGWPFWKQLDVLWNISFGSPCLAEAERKSLIDSFHDEAKEFSDPPHRLMKQVESIEKIALSQDAFCNPAIIDKQQVFEGREINVLYNYAPIVLGEEKLHFLIVPKQHREKFSDLSETEYVEAVQLSQKLVRFYRDKGYRTAYLFDKSGARAGQTVPHWHEHVLFTATKTQEFLGKLTIFKNMILGYSSPLPQEELRERVRSLKETLAEPLQ